jgi:hypothetical protein
MSTIRESCPDFQILHRDNNVILSETNPGHRIVYNYTHDGVNMATEIWTIKNGKSYLLAYGGEENVYNTNVYHIQRMFDSFRICNDTIVNKIIQTLEIGIVFVLSFPSKYTIDRDCVIYYFACLALKFHFVSCPIPFQTYQSVSF